MSLTDGLHAQAEEAEAESFAGILPGYGLFDIPHTAANDRSELLKNRFLCRGGGAILAGNTGIGKSTFEIQVATSFCLGRTCFGIGPNGSLRVLIIQAENDWGDIEEIRDGVADYMSLTPQDKREVSNRLTVVTDSEHTAEGFGKLLDQALTVHPSDLVIIDPALSYLGGDALQQRDVSKFLRNIVTPIIRKHDVGVIMIHHTAQPSRGAEKVGWQGSEYAYAPFGSSEWSNWARGVLFIRNIGLEDVFQLMAPKRGRRLGWTDAQGQRSNSRLIVQNRNGDAIFWRDAEDLDRQRVQKTQNARQASKRADTSLTVEERAEIVLPLLEDKPLTVDDFQNECIKLLPKGNHGKDKLRELRRYLVDKVTIGGQKLVEDKSPTFPSRLYIGTVGAVARLFESMKAQTD